MLPCHHLDPHNGSKAFHVVKCSICFPTDNLTKEEVEAIYMKGFSNGVAVTRLAFQQDIDKSKKRASRPRPIAHVMIAKRRAEQMAPLLALAKIQESNTNTSAGFCGLCSEPNAKCECMPRRTFNRRAHEAHDPDDNTDLIDSLCEVFAPC